MTTTAHEDQFTAAPEPVRQPYDTVAILRRNIASLEVALRTQTERAEKAEAELRSERSRLVFALSRDAFYDHTSAVFFCDPAFKIALPQVRIETNDFRSAIDALLQSAEPNNNAAADRLLEGGE